MRVEDNGCGLGDGTAGAGSRGRGILGMRERAEALGAHFQLDAAPHGGTRLSIKIALDAEASMARE
jgi:signal transduction histidine kinase